jgi:Calcineurin-like phosphoesterase
MLALADEVRESLYGPRLQEMRPAVVIACGDLPFDYLEYIVTVLNVPLLFVPGNHDPDLSKRAPRADPAQLLTPFLPSYMSDPPGPQGCTNLDGRVVDAAGLRFAGLGGSIRYSTGSNQYTETEMRRRALRLERNARRRGLARARTVDVLVTHASPAGVGDGDDPAHRGFAAFHRLIQRLSPELLVHGHVHPYGQPTNDHCVGTTQVVNAVAYRLLEVEP